jgi:hypothetical protein
MAKTSSAVETSEPIPQEVVHLAAARGLGELRATFLPKRMTTVRKVAFVIMVPIGLLMFILPGLWFIWIALQTPNFSRKQAAKRLYLFDHGLVVSESTGPVGCARWDQATVYQDITRHYRNGVYVATTYVYTLTNPDGSTVKVTQFFDDPQVWGAAIQQAVTRAQLPAVLGALKQGQTVRFGDIAVNSAGVSTPKRGEVAWAQIENVTVANGGVVLRKGGKLLPWSSRPVKEIPNFLLFMAAVDELRAGQDAA